MTARASADPLPLPSATSLRMVLVVTALIVSGMFVGTGLFNALAVDWTTTVLDCLSTNPLDVAAQLRCQAPAERERAAAAAGAAIVLVLLACVVVAVAPAVVRRRKAAQARGPALRAGPARGGSPRRRRRNAPARSARRPVHDG